MSRSREQWLHDIGARYKALENFTQEDARLQFLRILRSLPYGALSVEATLENTILMTGVCRIHWVLIEKYVCR